MLTSEKIIVESDGDIEIVATIVAGFDYLNNFVVQYDFEDYRKGGKDYTHSAIVNEEDGMVYGTVISSIYKGDHYQVIVRTDENEEDYIMDTEYTYNEGDRVGVIIPSDKIKMTLKVVNNAK